MWFEITAEYDYKFSRLTVVESILLNVVTLKPAIRNVKPTLRTPHCRQKSLNDDSFLQRIPFDRNTLNVLSYP